MTLTFGAASVLLVHSEALAQQLPEAPPPPVAPADPAPPASPAQAEAAPGQAEAAPAQPAPQQPAPPQPGYPPPPPPGYQQPYGGPPPGYGQTYRTYGGQQPPAWYPPPPPRGGIYRPFSLNVGIGPGTLASREQGKWNTDWGVAFDIRVGFGLSRNLQLQAGVDVVGASRQGYWFRQETALVGLQLYLTRAWYLRGAIGVSELSAESGGLAYDVGGSAFATSGAIGVELIQAPSTALALEAGTTLAKFDTTTWGSTGFKLVFSFF